MPFCVTRCGRAGAVVLLLEDEPFPEGRRSSAVLLGPRDDRPPRREQLLLPLDVAEEAIAGVARRQRLLRHVGLEPPTAFVTEGLLRHPSTSGPSPAPSSHVESLTHRQIQAQAASENRLHEADSRPCHRRRSLGGRRGLSRSPPLCSPATAPPRCGRPFTPSPANPAPSTRSSWSTTPVRTTHSTCWPRSSRRSTWCRTPPTSGPRADARAAWPRRSSEGTTSCGSSTTTPRPTSRRWRARSTTAARIPNLGMLGQLGGTLQFGIIRHGRDHGPIEFARDARQVDFVLTDGAVVTRTAFERVGVLDERYFIMMEDVEYPLRVKRAGLVVARADLGLAFHHLGATVGGAGGPSAPWRPLLPDPEPSADGHRRPQPHARPGLALSPGRGADLSGSTTGPTARATELSVARHRRCPSEPHGAGRRTPDVSGFVSDGPSD